MTIPHFAEAAHLVGAAQATFGVPPAYSVVGRLGEGGFGEVFEVTEIATGATFALKALKGSDLRRLTWFKAEFRALSRLSHPNLVRLFLLDTCGPQPFIVMEMVRGFTLAEHHSLILRRREAFDSSSVGPGFSEAAQSMSQQATWTEPSLAPTYGQGASAQRSWAGAAPSAERVDWEMLADAMVQILRALSFLHDRCGLVHCDLKPGNIMIGPDGVVKLLDFGLAYHQGQDFNSTWRKGVEGTPGYMAPEQLSGGELSPSVDIYALGKILQEYLELRSAWPPDQAAHGASESSAHGLHRQPRGKLEALCEAMLRSDPSERPTAVEALAMLGREGPAAPEEDSLLPPSDHSGADPSVRSPFVGRANAFRELKQLLHERPQRPRLGLITGVAGVGKSRLKEEFASWAESEGALVLSGRAHERETIPLQALDGILSSLVTWLAGMSAGRRLSFLPAHPEQLCLLYDGFRRILPMWATPQTPAEGEKSFASWIAALGELLVNISMSRPLLMIVDDAQWGDRDSARILVELAHLLVRTQSLILILSRTALGESAPGALAHRMSPLRQLRKHEVRLGPLTESEALTLADELGMDLTPERRRLLSEAVCAGARLPYELHLLVMWLRVAQPSCRLIRPEDALKQALGWRMTSISGPSRRLMETLCLAGRPTRQWIALDVAEIDPGEARHLVTRLIDLEFVLPSLIDAEILIEVRHDLLREAILDETPPERLCQGSQALARALESVGGTPPGVLARHFLDGGSLQEARVYALSALSVARERGNLDEVASLCRLLLRMELSNEERTTYLAICGDALARSGSAEDASECFILAAQGASQLRSLRYRVRASNLLLATGCIKEALELNASLAREVAIPFPRSKVAIFASILFWRLLIFFIGRRWWGRHRVFDPESPAAMRLESIRSLHIGLAWLDPIRPVAYRARHYVLAQFSGSPFHAAAALLSEAYSQSIEHWDSAADCQDLVDRARHIVARHPSRMLSWLLEEAQVQISFNLGRWEECIDRGTRLVGHFEELPPGNDAWRMESVQSLDRCRMAVLGAESNSGRFALLARDLPPAIKEWRRVGNLHWLSLCYIPSTQLWLTRGDADRAAEELESFKLPWKRDGFQVQSSLELVARTILTLYRGDSIAETVVAWEKMDEVMRAGGAFHVRFLRRMVADYMGRVAYAAALEGEDRRAQEALIRRGERLLRGDASDWAQGLGELRRGFLASLAGDRETYAYHLYAAVARFAAANMPYYREVCRWAAGHILGGDVGADLVHGARAWATTQGIKDADRMFATVIPHVHFSQEAHG